MIHAPMHPSWFACTACVLLALAAGAYRQWCIYFWERIELLPSTDAGNILPEDLRLNDYVPGWKSKKFRIGSWLFVAACGTLGAAWTTLLLRGPDIRPGIRYFLAILLARWVLSAITGIGAANYSLRKYGTGFQGTATQETGYRLQGSVEKSHHSVPGTGHRL